jgi:hypothetical protein
VQNVSGRVIHVEIIEIETLDQLNQSAATINYFFHLLQMNDDPICYFAKVLSLSKSSYQLR